MSKNESKIVKLRFSKLKSEFSARVRVREAIHALISTCENVMRSMPGAEIDIRKALYDHFGKLDQQRIRLESCEDHNERLQKQNERQQKKIERLMERRRKLDRLTKTQKLLQEQQTRLHAANENLIKDQQKLQEQEFHFNTASESLIKDRQKLQEQESNFNAANESLIKDQQKLREQESWFHTANESLIKDRQKLQEQESNVNAANESLIKDRQKLQDQESYLSAANESLIKNQQTLDERELQSHREQENLVNCWKDLEGKNEQLKETTQKEQQRASYKEQQLDIFGMSIRGRAHSLMVREKCLQEREISLARDRNKMEESFLERNRQLRRDLELVSKFSQVPSSKESTNTIDLLRNLQKEKEEKFRKQATLDEIVQLCESQQRGNLQEDPTEVGSLDLTWMIDWNAHVGMG